MCGFDKNEECMIMRVDSRRIFLLIELSLIHLFIISVSTLKRRPSPSASSLSSNSSSDRRRGGGSVQLTKFGM
jgi:hypothetical protein